MSKIKITVKGGAGNEAVIELEPTDTAGIAMANDVVKTIIGAGDNVQPIVNGVEVNADAQLNDGDVVEGVTKANTKGC